jgi:hypothetical protein
MFRKVTRSLLTTVLRTSRMKMKRRLLVIGIGAIILVALNGTLFSKSQARNPSELLLKILGTLQTKVGR